MIEREISFNGNMVHAILDDRKTHTRRVIKPQPIQDGRFFKLYDSAWSDNVKSIPCVPSHSLSTKNPYGKSGDRLKVKMELNGQEQCPVCGYTNHDMQIQMDHDLCVASNIRIEIINIHIERLQNISEMDARLEGIVLPSNFSRIQRENNIAFWQLGRHLFKDLWESIKGPGSWDENPWVWVIEFKRV